MYEIFIGGLVMLKRIKNKLIKIKEQKGIEYLEKISIPDIEEKDKNKVWAFNAGNRFLGNPKWLFIYINKYRKDITTYWICDSEDTIELIRSLGYRAYKFGTLEAEKAKDKTGVFVVENAKENLPVGMSQVKYLNLFHGVGCKPIERNLKDGALSEGIAKKYIKYNQFFRNNQLFLVTSPMLEENFKFQCGIDDDKVIKAGYPRCIYQKYNERVSTFDISFINKKLENDETKIAVYAPTFRYNSLNNFFSKAIPNMKKLIKQLKKNNMLLIFKVHPLMEKDPQYINAKEQFKDEDNLIFWDNELDFYEIMDRIDLAIIDYSSIFTDLMAAGVKYFIRYVFDIDNKENTGDLIYDYDDVTLGQKALSFDELLTAIDNYKEDYGNNLEKIYNMYWEFSGKDTFEKIINQTLEFEIEQRELPNLYSFDIFDTLICRKVLDPQGIFYYVKERMEENNSFPSFLVKNYPSLRIQAEKNVREYYRKTLIERNSERREITYDEILVRMEDLYGITKEQQALLKKWEFEAELENVIPIDENIKYVKSLISKNETVILISDMYLPKELILKMIEKADPILTTIPIFLSSDIGVEKVNKKLYLKVFNSYDFYDFKHWIHHGDNIVSDEKMPNQLGIQTIRHEVPTFNEYEQSLVNKIGSYDSYLVAASMARFRFNHPSKKDIFAYSYISLYFVPYISWAIKDAVNKGKKTLYFISRDGYHLKRIADKLIEIKGYDIKTKYIYASRKVWRNPSYIDKIDEGFWGGYGSFVAIETFEKLLNALNMKEDDFDKYFPDLNYVKNLDHIEPNELTALVEIFKNDSNYHKYLLEKSNEERKIVEDYLKQEINKNEKFAIVEYWGRGYTQECFQRLWEDVIKDEYNCEFYYVRSVLPSMGKNVRYNFTSNPTPIVFVETIFSNIPYKSIKEYKYDGENVVPIKNPAKCDIELFYATKKYLLQYVEDIYTLIIKNEDNLERELFDFAVSYYMENQNNPIFAETIAPLAYSEWLNGEIQEYAPAFTTKSIQEIFEGKETIQQYTKSRDMSVNRTRGDALKLFNKMYQIDPNMGYNSFGPKLNENDLERSNIIKNEIDNFEATSVEKQRMYNKMLRCPINNNKIVFISKIKKVEKTETLILKKLLKAHDEINTIDIEINGTDISENQMKDLATAKYIIMSSPMDIMAMLKIRKETKIIQLCDFAFAFTKFGLSRNFKIRYNKDLLKLKLKNEYDLVSVAANSLIPIFAEEWDIKSSMNIKALGSCQTDVFYDKEFKNNSFEKLYKVFPEAKNKKVIFYMPLHRYRNKAAKYVEFLDISLLNKKLSNDYVIIINNNTKPNENNYFIQKDDRIFAKDLTNILSMRESMIVSDIIVGDYRRTLFEAALLNKPIFLTAHDYAEITRKLQTRFKYLDIKLGPIINNAEELIEHINHLDKYDYSLMNSFKDKYLTMCDGHSSQRILDYILSDINQNKKDH